MNKKKIIIYAVAAVLVLGLGIFLGIKLSGGDEEDGKTTVADASSGKTNTVSNTDASSSDGTQSGVTGKIADSEVKASDIGQPIMPGGDQEKSNMDPVDDGEPGTGISSGSIDEDDRDDVDKTSDAGKGGADDKASNESAVTENSGNSGSSDAGSGKEDKEGTDNGSGKSSDTGKGGSDTSGNSDKGNDSGLSNNGNDDQGNSSDIENGEEKSSGSDDKDNDTGNNGTGSGSGQTDDSENDTQVKKPAEVVIAKPVSTINTGKLTESGNGYEGTKGTSKYNYGEALQKSILFYELQRSGDLPDKVRCNWRGDSCVNDGKDAGLDLSGGWYDAGDNVKFNLPMSYTASMLGWSIIEDAKAYEESGQLSYALGNIKWANDYFIKCHPSDEVYYYQVGDGNQDHSYWGAAETVEYRMSRPSYKVTKSSPGSAVCGETAASLAICSIIYKNIDPSYSSLCLKHAKSLYKFARDTKSDAGYTAANGFYNSWSGFYDELAWSAAWLYCATGDETYIKNAEEDFKNAGHDYDWSMCWDDVHIGAALMLAKLTEKQTYKDEIEKHLDWWSGVSTEHITYSPKGLAWLDSWGSLRYATTTSFIALSYVDSGICPSSKVKAYTDFAEKQANYALGSSGRSYVVGFGENAPQNPHHRTAQGSYCDNMNEPNPARHTLYGALVGGPDANDGYNDVVSDYNKNEVACDYNAGFTGLLAKMYAKYHGQTLKDFGAVEPIDTDEFYVQGGINVDGSDFIEIKALICNVSAWPARGGESLEYRYYVDLSEVYKAGGSASDIVVTTNYMAAGKAAGIKAWDEDKHIYYLSVDFSDSVIYPGGQDKYKKEIQVRLRNPNGTWDNSNDPSFAGMTKGGNALLTSSALYEG